MQGIDLYDIIKPFIPNPNVIVTGVIGVAIWKILDLIIWNRRDQTGVEVSVERIVVVPWSVALKGNLANIEKIEKVKKDDRKVHDWLLEQDGVDHVETKLLLSVRGVAEKTVIIRNIRVEVEHSEPYSGTKIKSPSAGANQMSLLMFNLDEKKPKAWQYKDYGVRRGKKPFFEENNVTLNRNEVHDLRIVGYAKKHLATWKLYLDLKIGNKSKTIEVIDNNSKKPFKTSGYPKSGFKEDLLWGGLFDYKFVPKN